MSKYYDDYWKIYQHAKLNDFHYKWPAIKHYIPSQPYLNILDFGCGTGDILEEIVKINPTSVYYGIDVSRIALTRAKRRLPKVKFYLINDGDRIPTKDYSMDFVVALDVIEHVYNTKATLEELFRVLKPGGKLLVTTPYHGLLKNLILVTFFFEQYFHPEGSHIRYYSKQSIVKELNNVGFEVTELGYFGRFFPLSRAMYVLANKTK